MRDSVVEVRDTVKALSVQLGEIGRRVDLLERDAAVRAATWEAYREAYQEDVARYRARQEKRSADQTE